MFPSTLCCTIWGKYATTRLVWSKEREEKIQCCLSTLSSKPVNWSFYVIVLTSTGDKCKKNACRTCSTIPFSSFSQWYYCFGIVVTVAVFVSKVVFYWDQPFQPQPISVEAVEVSQQNTFPTVFAWNVVTPGNSYYQTSQRWQVKARNQHGRSPRPTLNGPRKRQRLLPILFQPFQLSLMPIKKLINQTNRKRVFPNRTRKTQPTQPTKTGWSQ